MNTPSLVCEQQLAPVEPFQAPLATRSLEWVSSNEHRQDEVRFRELLLRWHIPT